MNLMYNSYLRPPLPSITVPRALTLSLAQGISVSLPTWAANRGWANQEACIVEKMQTGYPR